ncbi:W protein [Beilong virus]|uniref:W protein n=1 Tax=Beilong virus TaxID=341053 RepID=Q287X9_9MONO|nr:W protein [Beilong virus]AAZ82807.1 W protein [Beilong virus]AOV81773.1 W protein [Beilong virus]AOV81784.1 W protein [Beilong virus]
MSDYNPDVLQQLVKDGIKTIELLQQSPEDFQKTYGRSAIQEPSTRARIQSWESRNPDHDYTGNKNQRSEGAKERANKSESAGTASADGGHGDKPSNNGGDSQNEYQGSDQQVWDAAYNDGNSGGAWGGPTGGLPTAGERGYPITTGNQEFEGYHPDGPVDAREYNQISSMDHEMSAAETLGSSTQLTTMRNATTDDFAKIFEEGTPKVHRRLRGITAVVPAQKQPGAVGGPVKKGAPTGVLHRHFWGTYHYPGVVQSPMCTPHCYTNPKRMLMRRMPKAVCKMYRRPGLLAKVTRLHTLIRRLKENSILCLRN